MALLQLHLVATLLVLLQLRSNYYIAATYRNCNIAATITAKLIYIPVLMDCGEVAGRPFICKGL
jgi:hypothetical protein